jgi:hypothetical protein
MEQSRSWEANSSSASQGIISFVRIPKVHYRVQKISPLVPHPSQINVVLSLPPYILSVHFNIILLLVCFTRVFPLKFFMHSILSHVGHMRDRLDVITQIIWPNHKTPCSLKL